MGHIAKHHETAAPVRVDGPPPLSPKLRAAIETPTVSRYGEHGFEQVPGAWKLPAVVDGATRDEAARQLAWMDDVQMLPASTMTMRRWMLALGNAVASSSALTEVDVQAKVGALLTMLEDYPAGVFTNASLKRAGRQFTFFPGPAELMKLLDREAEELTAKQGRFRAIAEAKPVDAEVKPEALPTATDTQKEAVRQMLAAAGIGLKGAANAAQEGVEEVVGQGQRPSPQMPKEAR